MLQSEYIYDEHNMLVSHKLIVHLASTLCCQTPFRIVKTNSQSFHEGFSRNSCSNKTRAVEKQL